MSFIIQEASAEAGHPVELYTITLGTEFFRNTSAEDTQVIASQTYTATALERTNIRIGAEERTQVITLTLPGDHEFTSKFKSIPPGKQGQVRIDRYHRTDGSPPELQLIFEGVVRTVGFDDNGLSSNISVMPLTGALAREVPRFVYSGLCNHVLYDQGCKVAKTGGNIWADTVDTVAGNTLVIGGIDAGRGVGWATGGYVEFPGSADFRMVLKHEATDTLTLLLPFRDDVTGENVIVFAGCDHQYGGDCGTKFSNQINYGGFPWVPIKNPFEEGLEQGLDAC